MADLELQRLEADLGVEAGFSPHCEVGFSLERQFLEVGFDQVVLAAGRPDSEIQLEADFDRHHLAAAFVCQLEAYFHQQLEAVFGLDLYQQFEADFSPDIGLDNFFGMIECCGSIAALVSLGNLEQG